MQEQLNSEFSLAEYYDLMCEVLNSGGEFTLYPRGTSMLPLIRQNRDAVVLVKPTKRLLRRDIPLYRRTNGQFVLHRVITVTDKGNYTMCGDNQLALEKDITHSQIIAVVCAFIRDGKRIKTNSVRYKLYTLLWCIMPLRRLVFKIRSLLYKVKAKLRRKHG